MMYQKVEAHDKEVPWLMHWNDEPLRKVGSSLNVDYMTEVVANLSYRIFIVRLLCCSREKIARQGNSVI